MKVIDFSNNYEINAFNEEGKFPYTIIDNLYSDTEVSYLFEELDYLNNPLRTRNGKDDTAGAHENGVRLKNTNAVYLENFFIERQNSNILNITEKIFVDNRKLFSFNENWFFQNLNNINNHTTQVLYYDEGNENKPHYDEVQITILNWFFREPKCFTGGDLIFSDYDISVECKHNRSIIFPSIIYHGITPIKMREEYRNKKLGRYCISQFLNQDTIKKTQKRLTDNKNML